MSTILHEPTSKWRPVRFLVNTLRPLTCVGALAVCPQTALQERVESAESLSGWMAAPIANAPAEDPQFAIVRWQASTAESSEKPIPTKQVRASGLCRLIRLDPQVCAPPIGDHSRTPRLCALQLGESLVLVWMRGAMTQTCVIDASGLARCLSQALSGGSASTARISHRALEIQALRRESTLGPRHCEVSTFSLADDWKWVHGASSTFASSEPSADVFAATHCASATKDAKSVGQALAAKDGSTLVVDVHMNGRTVTQRLEGFLAGVLPAELEGAQMTCKRDGDSRFIIGLGVPRTNEGVGGAWLFVVTPRGMTAHDLPYLPRSLRSPENQGKHSQRLRSKLASQPLASEPVLHEPVRWGAQLELAKLGEFECIIVSGPCSGDVSAVGVFTFLGTRLSRFSNGQSCIPFGYRAGTSLTVQPTKECVLVGLGQSRYDNCLAGLADRFILVEFGGVGVTAKLLDIPE